MSMRKATIASTGRCSDSIRRLQDSLSSADAIVIGAGSGLSSSAGHTYSGARFKRNFADFIARYRFTDMYSAGFYPYAAPEEYWAYWSRYIALNRYAEDGGAVYGDLLRLTEGKDCFVITTNVDHCFQRAGFDKERLFYTQGDYGLWQCAKPCHAKTYDNEAAVRRMVAAQRDMRIPTGLLPHCPVCGRAMAMNLRSDDSFVEDQGWRLAAARYQAFLDRQATGRVLYLELGVGNNTPVIIKFPFWRRTRQNPNAIYACINLGEAYVPAEIADRSICINRDIGQVLRSIRG